MRAMADAGRDQAARRLVDTLGDFAKGVARGAEHQPLAVRQAGCDVVREIAEAAAGLRHDHSPMCIHSLTRKTSS